LTGPRKRGEEAAGADSRTVVVDIPDNLALRHEWLEEERDYRQFLIPAGLVTATWWSLAVVVPGAEVSTARDGQRRPIRISRRRFE
jgi:hypothetical protein